jgi:AcrR family transcriptional regulator
MAPRRNDPGFRTAILDAAARLIAERGYRAVRIADIAAECDTSTGSVHYWFAGKQDVLRAALRHATERAIERQSEALREIDDARDRLVALIEMQLPTDGEIRREWGVWLQYWAEAAIHPEMQELHRELYGRWSEAIARTIERGQRQGVLRAGPADTMAQTLTALIDGAATQVMTGVDGATPQRMHRLLVAYVDEHLAAR